MVEALRVFSQNGHVDHARLPDLAESTVDFVRDALVEFDGADIRIEVQTASKSENDRATGKVSVWKASTRITNGAQEDGVGFVLTKIKGTLSPFFSCGFVVFSPAGNNGLRKTVVRMLLNGVKNALGFKRHFSTRPVAWQNRDAMVTHTSSHIALLHERDPFQKKKKRLGMKRRPG